MKVEKIGNIAQFVNGYAFKPSHWEESGKKIIRIQNLTDPSKPYNKTRLDVPEKYLVKKGDILISWSATIDVFEWDDEDALLNQHIFKVVFDKRKVEKEYFKQAIKKTVIELARFAHGATMKHVVKGDFESHKIFLPPLEEQIQIATVLSKAENLIAKRKESIELLDEFVKSTFKEMFGDPVRNEKGWEKRKLYQYLDKIDSGWSPVCENFPAEKDNWGVLKLSAVTSCIYNGCENKSLPINISPKVEKEVKKGDVLFTRKNTKELVAACAYVFKTREKLMMSDTIFRLEIKDRSLLNPIFLWKLLCNEKFRKNVQNLASGSAGSMPNISKQSLLQIDILIPPTQLQNKFAQIANKVEALKVKCQESLEELENWYGSLSQRAFRGEFCSNAELQIKDTSSIPEHSKGFAKQVLGGKIVSLFKDDENFTNIKFQKLQYLAEHIAEEALLPNYYKEVAGPYDNRFMHTVFNHLEKNKWFEQKYSKFTPMEKSGDIEKYFQGYFSKKSDKLNKFFNLLKNASEKLCEAIATIYAVWNNHIIQGLEFDKNKIKKEFFEWSKRKKLVFTEEEFEKALEWMQKHQIIPTGFGKLIKEKT